jgi:hypothetical protein
VLLAPLADTLARAPTLTIHSETEAEEARAWLAAIVDRRSGPTDSVAALCDPVVKAAHDAHRAALAMRKELDAPLAQAEAAVREALSVYYTAQEREAAQARQLLAASLEADAVADPMQDEEEIVLPAVPLPTGLTRREVTVSVVSMPQVLHHIASGRLPASVVEIVPSRLKRWVLDHPDVSLPGLHIVWSRVPVNRRSV